MRRVIPVLAVVLLVAAVWFFWPDDADSPTTTTPEASGSTSTTSPPDPTTTGVTPTTTDGSHVVETVGEAEAILRELWFGWFEGIYNQDEDRIREVVASELMLTTAQAAFGAAFVEEPTAEAIRLDLELLHSDEECLVTWGELDVTPFRGPEAIASSVQVLRWVEGSWRFFTSWANRNDLWEADCDAQLLPLS